jgi:hypothetical protein
MKAAKNDKRQSALSLGHNAGAPNEPYRSHIVTALYPGAVEFGYPWDLRVLSAFIGPG